MVLSSSEWNSLADTHRREVESWTQPFRVRRSRQQPHPVHDFLFTYYNYSAAKLETWHPQAGVILTEAERPAPYTKTQSGAILDPKTLREKDQTAMRWILNLLERTQARPANFACHGVHEWAMVYEGQEVRHESCTTLRLPQDEIDAFVRSRPICCSHFDAFRFFAPTATGFNKLTPTFDTREDNEQSACLHANMDIYKWAYRCMPWIGSELLLACFHLALDIRALDMEASPYDLSEWGYTPVKIETLDGRRIYETRQRAFAERANALRQRLTASLEIILASASQAS